MTEEERWMAESVVQGLSGIEQKWTVPHVGHRKSWSKERGTVQLWPDGLLTCTCNHWNRPLHRKQHRSCNHTEQIKRDKLHALHRTIRNRHEYFTHYKPE